MSDSFDGLLTEEEAARFERTALRSSRLMRTVDTLYRSITDGFMDRAVAEVCVENPAVHPVDLDGDVAERYISFLCIAYRRCLIVGSPWLMTHLATELRKLGVTEERILNV